MDILRSLIQNLIVIVILAMFLEMLLPAGAMRKYVKMVMGLLIIVAVVQAVGQLVRWDYSKDLPALVQRDERSQLAGIMEAGRKISGEHQQRALEQYRQGLANQVRALAGMSAAVPVVGVEVKVNSSQGEPDYGHLQEIILTVAKDQAGPGAGGGLTVAVEPVTVQVGGPAETPGQAGDQAGPQPQNVSDLINNVANFYNLSPDQVKIIYR